MYIKLPIPPSTNVLYQKAKSKDSKFKMEYYLQVQQCIQEQYPEQLECFRGFVDVKCHFYIPMSKDLDNNFKALFDALTYSKIIENDKYVMSIQAKKIIHKQDQQYCEIWIEQSQ